MTAPTHEDAKRILDDFGGKLPSHVEQMLLAYIAAAEQTERERDKARADYQFMVERAANEKLDGYRELGERLAASERERDELKVKLEFSRSHGGRGECMDDGDGSGKCLYCGRSIRS